jgi:hypothetical protein
MLEPKHIVKLQLDHVRLAVHQTMPQPRYVNKPLIGQFTTLSDTILTSLLQIDPEAFRQQLELARQYGTTYLTEDSEKRPIGITATTSLIKSGTVITKSLIVPQDFLKFDRRLSDHLIVGVFVRGHVDQASGLLAYDDSVEVAGWATSRDIQHMQAIAPPPTFQSKLRVLTVPCTALRPINTLLQRLMTDNLVV